MARDVRTYTIRVDRELAIRMERAAGVRGVNQWIEQAIEDRLDRDAANPRRTIAAQLKEQKP